MSRKIYTHYTSTSDLFQKLLLTNNPVTRASYRDIIIKRLVAKALT